MKFRNPYNYDTDISSFHSGLDCSDDPSRAQQHMKDETDINTLVKIYARTGIVPGADFPATDVSFDDIFDFQSAMNALVAAERSFGALPSDLRARFNNDPGRFLSFIDNADNREEAVRLGLIPPPPPPPPSEQVIEPVSEES